MSVSAQPNTDAAIMARLIEPEQDNLAVEAARYILGIAFSASDTERMNDLAAKCGEGPLTEQEQRELEAFRRSGNVLSLMKAKARLSLKRAGAPA